MDSYAPYLPQVIIISMLKRLPVKSLIRFGCVCKDWKNLFKTPSFITEQLHHSTQKNPCLIFDCKDDKSNLGHLCLINLDMQVLEYQTPPFTDSSMVDECRFVHSSNGLLCLELIESKSYILWNPAIREVLQVPKVLDLHLLGTPFVSPKLRRLVIPSLVGFGFDPIANDYKIVRLSASIVNNHVIHTVEVFSLNKRSWKEVEAGKLEFIFPFKLARGCGFTFDEAIFWLGFKLVKKDESSHYLILSFDIATESFTLIPLSSYIPISRYNRLTVSENKLAMLANTDLWVMDKFVDASGERWIWTKIYTGLDGLLRPHAIWQNEIFCELEASSALYNDEEELVLCNLHTNEFKMLSIGKYPIRTQILNYEESLVSVGNMHFEASSS